MTNNGQLTPIGRLQAVPPEGTLEDLLLDCTDQRNETQLNIRLPAAAKQMIERLARRKTVGVSTLVRMWVIECLRREAAGAPDVLARHTITR